MITVRYATKRDEVAWRKLWRAYNQFFAANVASTVTAATWQRILSPTSTLFCRVAEKDELVVGFAVCVLHEGSWVTTPICYLEDLFVDADYRGAGIGKALIDDLFNLGKSENWSRIYWHTQHDNPARKLYDQYSEADEFVRYRCFLE